MNYKGRKVRVIQGNYRGKLGRVLDIDGEWCDVYLISDIVCKLRKSDLEIVKSNL